jgi:hypothetical protein
VEKLLLKMKEGDWYIGDRGPFLLHFPPYSLQVWPNMQEIAQNWKKKYLFVFFSTSEL